MKKEIRIERESEREKETERGKDKEAEIERNRVYLCEKSAENPEKNREK